MFQPKVVLFTYSGRSIPALVLAARSGETSHLGKNGEPILTLAFIDPARETGLKKDENGEFVYPIGRIPNVFIEHDVVHASHEFDEEFLRKHGSSPAQIASQRGHGEWSDFQHEDFDEMDADRVIAWSQVHEERNRANSAESRASLAESLVASLRKELADLKNQGNAQSE